jgi:hypothetical protein
VIARSPDAPDGAPVTIGIQVPLAEVARLSDFTGHIKDTHPLRGTCIASDVPFLIFKLASTVKAADAVFRKVGFLAWGWDANSGGALTITAYTPDRGQLARVHVDREDSAFESLRRGQFTAIFTSGSRPLYAVRVDFSDTPKIKEAYLENWTRARDHRGVIDDRESRFWEVLGRVHCFNLMTPLECLRVGWAGALGQKLSRLSQLLDTVARGPDLVLPDSVPALASDLVKALATSNFHLSDFLSVLRELTSATDRRFLECLEAIGPIQTAVCGTFGDDHSRCFLFSAALDILSAQASQLGTRLPCIDVPSGRLAYIHLAPDEFPKSARPEDYWKRLPPGPVVGWNGVVAGNDFPIDASSREDDFPVAVDHAAASATADSLLDEAVSQKRWTIPPGASVPLRAGMFEEFQLWEREHDVVTLCRTAEREFLLCILEADKHWFDIAAELNVAETKSRKQAAAGLKLLIAALVRDFWVVEQRERVFTERIRTPRSDLPSHADGPRVVYLPRVRYTGTADVSRCLSELGYESRAAHFVAPHIRKVTHASPHQLVIASRYGLNVPPGFTFVRPHERGAGQRDTVYRSRSALSCLFDDVDPGTSGPMTDGWFEFERRVERWLASHGFTIQHKRPTLRGDGGVDVFATKGEGFEEVSWVVQCKRYRRNKVLGPNVVREIIGALRAYPSGTRGLIVATCRFSSGARQLASGAAIKLMDHSDIGNAL